MKIFLIKSESCLSLHLCNHHFDASKRS